MLKRFRYDVVIPLWHRCVSCVSGTLLCVLALLACKVHAQLPPAASPAPTNSSAVAQCLPDGGGYLRAKLGGALQADLDWGNEGTLCTGAVRPADEGIRIRFSRALQTSASDHVVLVFGAKLSEGRSSRNLPVNVTLIREGSGEFYSTQGDDKCTLDEVRQEPIVGIPNRQRSYRVIVRGFCTEPARAVRGTGAVLISRFDFAGRVDFGEEVSETAGESD